MARLWPLLLAVLLVGCATITKGTTQMVAIDTPGVPGASCTISTSSGLQIVNTPRHGDARKGVVFAANPMRKRMLCDSRMSERASEPRLNNPTGLAKEPNLRGLAYCRCAPRARDDGATGVGLRAGATDGCDGGSGIFAISCAMVASNRAISRAVWS
jgi:hypothetical protein